MTKHRLRAPPTIRGEKKKSMPKVRSQVPRRSSLENGDAKELDEMHEEREESEDGDEDVHEPRGRASGHVEFEDDEHVVANSSPHGMQ
jgi:hypothetical protein